MNNLKHLLIIYISIYVCQPIYSQCPNIFLNEIHYDNSGSDIGEFIEIAVDNNFTGLLADYSVSLYNGDNGLIYNTETLDNFIQGVNDGNYTYYTWSPPSIQNGAPDGFSLDHQGTLCEFLSYEGAFTGSGGSANGISSTDIGIEESNSTPVGSSIQLINGIWSGPFDDTPGGTNSGTIISSVSIGDVNQLEGNTGNTTFSFIVSMDIINSNDVTFDFSTVDSTATISDNDFIAISGVGTINAGLLMTTVDVTVVGDYNTELTEVFKVEISNVSSNAIVVDSLGIGTIQNDDITGSCSDAFLNEIHYDNDGSDTNEFIEVALDNTFAGNLADFSIHLYNGNNGLSYDSQSMDNLVQGMNDGIYTYYTWHPATIQNGAPDGFSLSFNGNLCALLSYEGTFIATGGPAMDTTSIDIGVMENGTDPFGLSLQLINGMWTNPIPETPGTNNTSNNCPNNYDGINMLTGIETGTMDYETDGIISSDQSITATADIDYDSGTEINLIYPFEVQLGALFDAFIDGCGGGL